MAGTEQTPPFDPTKIHTVRIFPSIGIARVGNSQDGWFYGPEVPGRSDVPPGGFKDANGAVKRQAARFRAYAFDVDGNVLCEANKASGFHLDWSLAVANQKAAWFTFMGSMQDGAFQPGFTTLRNPDVPSEDRHKLVVSSGKKELSGPDTPPVDLSGTFQSFQTESTDVHLGKAWTDDQGRLVVLAGLGYSHSIKKKDDPYPLIMTDFDSPDWIDDTSDGWIDVTATYTPSQSTFTAPNKARVVGTAPKFAAGAYAPTSLYDLMEEVYEQKKRKDDGDNYDVGDVDWYRHIWPLLQRPPLLSWVNIMADRGHGPNGPGNFFEDDWYNNLSSPSEKNKTLRQNVLGRMRLPSTNKKYDKARAGQAYPYFMPWLSGDNGRTTAGDPSTFASITELQYDRLVKWSNGDFSKHEPKFLSPPDAVEDLDVQEQPGALTKASLEATIGAPLFPGIEMSWNMEKSWQYQLDVPFTICEDALPGDLTKYLSLPWQSDFYMCRNYWWPSARPDSIVTEAEYDRVSSSVPLSKVAKMLNHRVPWERGLHENYTDTFPDQPLFANTDMARRWHELGFIVPKKSGQKEPIFVETQRTLSNDNAKKLARSHRTGIKHGGGITLPKPDTPEIPITTVESLRTHLQSAMAVELSTIPLYLFGMYSVKTPKAFANDPIYDDPIIAAVRNVVAEEMLHLSLAGNILLAVGGKPQLYKPSIIPSYPMLMPGRIPPLRLELREMSKPNLETFIQVEKPEPKNAVPEPDSYHTLGQFYAAIEQGLEYLNPSGNLFDTTKAPFQFAPGLGYQPRIRDAGGSVIVTDLDSARRAIKIIVDQGEGNSRPYDDVQHLEKDHYDVFKDLQHGKANWECYPVVSNPTTLGYSDKRIYHVSLTFDAAYCFLLLTIETLWTIDSNDRRHKLILGNMFQVMMGVLAPLAKFLLQQPIRVGKDRGKVAAPSFGYYHFEEGSSALHHLQREMQDAMNAYLDVTAENEDQAVIHDYGKMLEILIPIQQTIDGLLDLKTCERLKKPSVKEQKPGVQTTGAKGFARGA